MADRFFDTNIIVYLLSADERKAQIARELIEQGGMISIQVLGEFANVARRKAGLPLDEISETTGLLRELLEVVPMTEEIFEMSLDVARKTGYSTFDSMIVAAAFQSGAETLLTEDMQSGREILGLKLVNPFALD